MAEIEVEGLAELLAKLGPELLARPVHDLLQRCGIETINKGHERAPWDTGRLAGSLTTNASEGIFDMDNAALPTWVKVGTNVNREGFRYPKALDESDRYHYRGGRAQGRMSAKAGAKGAMRGALMGQETKGWFSDVPGMLIGKYLEMGRKMLDEVRARWLS